MNKTVALVSLGCSKNLVDGENMLGLIRDKGYEIVENEEDAEVIIVNTCTFIEDAKKESIEVILDLADYKNNGKCKRLIVTGCLAQRYREQVREQLPEVDAVLGVGNIEEIIDAIEGKDEFDFEKPYTFFSANPVHTTPDHYKYLKIADGCDNHCTYCVIPSIRGKYISRPMEDIVAEAEKLVKNGAKELIVIAQDTTYYGKDLYGEFKICELLEKLCKIEDLKWIRLHYCYPERITDELIDLISKEDKICKYLDIPIQHCNDRILKLMGRRTSKEQLVELFGKLRKKIPDIVIRTTVITGFPSETEEEFMEVEDFLLKMKFERIGFFPYSREEDTPAYNLPDQVEQEEAQRRADMLTFTQSEIIEEIGEKFIGKTFDVLVEGYDEIIKSYFGRSYMDSIDIDGMVFFKSAKKLKTGDFVKVEIEQIEDYNMFGKIAD